MLILLIFYVGECGCGKNVVDVVILGVIWIGYGIVLKDIFEYLVFLKEKKVFLEMCLISNF